jgi:hypothetical protein
LSFCQERKRPPITSADFDISGLSDIVNAPVNIIPTGKGIDIDIGTDTKGPNNRLYEYGVCYLCTSASSRQYISPHILFFGAIVAFLESLSQVNPGKTGSVLAP